MVGQNYSNFSRKNLKIQPFSHKKSKNVAIFLPKNGQKPFSGDPGDPVPHGYTLACTLHYAAVMFSCRHMTAAAAAVSTLMQFLRTFVHRTTKTFLYAFYGRNSKSEFPSLVFDRYRSTDTDADTDISVTYRYIGRYRYRYFIF